MISIGYGVAISARSARRQAVAFGIVLRLVLRVVVVDGRGPRLERHLRLGFGAAAPAASGAFAAASGYRAPRPSRRDHVQRLPRRLVPSVPTTRFAHVGDVGHVPDAFFAGHTSKVRRAVREARRRLRRSNGTAAPEPAARLIRRRRGLTCDPARRPPRTRRQHHRGRRRCRTQAYLPLGTLTLFSTEPNLHPALDTSGSSPWLEAANDR